MVRESLGADKPGPDLRARVAAELQARHDQWDRMLRDHAEDDNTEWARWWHERRLEHVRANAAQYGLEPDETLPRMLPEYRQCDTFRDDMKDVPHRWGVPEGLDLVNLRDLCRELLISPLSLHRWSQQGLPTLRYHPWVLYDRARAKEWLDRHQPEPIQPMDAEQARQPLLTAMEALTQGLATPDEGEALYDELETAHFLAGRDPLWAAEWDANRERERRENAAHYGLAEPTASWLGIPQEEYAGNVFEIRDLTRRLGLSPIEVVRWTRQGMPCLRSSPLVRWHIRHVTAWLTDRGLLPSHHTIKELDVTERFVCLAVAAHQATPDEGHEALSGWIGVM